MQNFGTKRPQGRGGFGSKLARSALSFGSKVANGVSRVARTAADVGGGVLSVADWIPGAGVITGPARAAVNVARGIADASGVIGGLMDVGARGMAARDSLER